MQIFVGGINGVGKSTLLREVQKQKPDWRVTKNSSAFMEWLGIPGDYEKLRALSENYRNEQMFPFIENLLTETKGAPAHFLDSHYLNLKRGMIDKVTGPWIKNFDALVLVSSPIDKVIERIKKDAPERDRALFPPGATEEEQKQMLTDYEKAFRQEFLEIAKRYNLPKKEIVNDDLKEAAEELITFVESL